MNLKRAFTERARLNADYNKLYSEFRSYPFSTVVPEAEEGLTIEEYPVKDTYTKLCELEEIIALLNAAIDKANANSDARYIIAQLNGLKMRANLISSMVQSQKSFKEKVKELDRSLYDANGNSGVYVVREYVKTSDLNFVELQRLLQQEIRNKEDELEEVNVKTEVELDDRLKDFFSK